MGDWVLPDYRPIVKQQSQPEENDQKSGYWLFWCGLLPCFRSQQHPRRHICIELHFRHLRSAEAVKFTPGQAYKRQEAIANAIKPSILHACGYFLVFSRIVLIISFPTFVASANLGSKNFCVL